MKRFADYNPIVLFIYFTAISSLPVICMNPAIAAISLCGGAALFIQIGGARVRDAAVFGTIFIVMTAINPIIHHNGVTVLFVAGDNPITLEAVVYGIVAAGAIVSLLIWFRTFTKIMTSDRLLYLFGRISPKFALLLSMALRYIPLFGAQAKRVNDSQRALGLYRDDNIIDDIRGGVRVFSVMVGWALENGIITADSMAARGYGIGRRSFFAIYKFRRSDAALLAATAALFGAAAAGVALGAVKFTFYPSIKLPDNKALEIAVYVIYTILSFIPTYIEAGEGVKWKYLQSKI